MVKVSDDRGSALLAVLFGSLAFAAILAAFFRLWVESNDRSRAKLRHFLQSVENSENIKKRVSDRLDRSELRSPPLLLSVLGTSSLPMSDALLLKKGARPNRSRQPNWAKLRAKQRDDYCRQFAPAAQSKRIAHLRTCSRLRTIDTETVFIDGNLESEEIRTGGLSQSDTLTLSVAGTVRLHSLIVPDVANLTVVAIGDIGIESLSFNGSATSLLISSTAGSIRVNGHPPDVRFCDGGGAAGHPVRLEASEMLSIAGVTQPSAVRGCILSVPKDIWPVAQLIGGPS